MNQKYKLFAVGAIGTFMATLDGSIVNVALPTIAESLGASVDAVSWVVLSYTLTLIALMLVFGAWVQRRGYAFGYRFGYVFFMLGSLTCSFAPDIYLLVSGRIIQAVGTAMFAAIGPGMITTVFPPAERGKGLGLMVMMVSAGFMTGPPLGGLMLSVWPWQSIFLINIPVAFFGLWMVHRYFGQLKQKLSSGSPRVAAASAMSISLLAAVIAMKMIGRWSMSDIRIWMLAFVSVTALIIFLRFESQPEKSMIGLSIFKNRHFMTAIAAQQALFISASSLMILLPFYLERVQGLAPKEVGLYLVILPLSMFVLAPLTGWLSDRVGYRLLTSFGMASLGFAIYLIGQFGVSTSQSEIIVSFILFGIGIGSFGTPNSSALMGSVDKSLRAVTSSILATGRNIGQAVGVALSTALFSYYEIQHSNIGNEQDLFVAAFQPVARAALFVAAIGLIICLTRATRIDSNKAIDSGR